MLAEDEWIAADVALAGGAGEDEFKTVKFKVVFDAIRQLMTPAAPKKGRIGFRPSKKE